MSILLGSQSHTPMSFSISTSSPLFHSHLRRLSVNPKPKPPPPLIRCSSPSFSSFSDPFVLEIAEKLEDSIPTIPPLLQPLRDVSSQSLLSKPWPTSKQEPFRFTDLSFLKNSHITPSSPPPTITLPQLPPSSSPTFLTILNGHVVPSLSRTSSLPQSVFAGSVQQLPPSLEGKISSYLVNDGFGNGDVFFDLNGVGAADVAVVYVPAGVRVCDEPVHLRFCYDEGREVGEGKLSVSSPRLLVVAEKGAELAIVEEHLGVGEGEGRCYWGNVVVDIVVEEGARVSHTYLQRQSGEAAHVKWTFTRQEASSSYELIEVSTGGRLSRHNLHIQQLGPDTVTELSAFHVAQANQIQDLHSRLVLDHPRGHSRQLHKCIVSHSSGHAIFDGNVRVNRLAQQTDAGQLTRTLLMAPRATVNLKPNLQIVADDVKCSHGATVSDLEEEQLFYFQARGIDLQTARDALVFSFGAEVFDRIPFEAFRKSVATQVKEVLAVR